AREQRCGRESTSVCATWLTVLVSTLRTTWSTTSSSSPSPSPAAMRSSALRSMSATAAPRRCRARSRRASVRRRAPGCRRSARPSECWSSASFRGRLEDAVADRALRVVGRQLGADAIELSLQTLEYRRVRLTLVPLRDLGADLLQRASAALVKRIRLRRRFVEKLLHRALDSRFVLRRQLDQRADIARTPLQPRRRSLRFVERLLRPAQRRGLVAALPRVRRQLR